MFHFQPWCVAFLVVLGNCGFWLYLFNRVNAAGWPRKITKQTEKLIVFLCFALPLAIGLIDRQALFNWLGGSRWLPQEGLALNMWGAWSMASCLVLGALWLESRRWLIPPKHLLRSSSQIIPVGQQIPGGSTADRQTTWYSCLPGNQITDLSITRKELQLARTIPGVDGLKIGHISDLHFTGQFRFEHYQRVIEHLGELSPDWIVLTGDILDHDRFVPWVAPLLGQLTAPMGCTFLLGNHDLRLTQLDRLLEEMRQLGHFDIGVQDQELYAGELRIEVSGNENPWFERHSADQRQFPLREAESPVLRVGLAHTPDQISWRAPGKWICCLQAICTVATHGFPWSVRCWGQAITAASLQRVSFIYHRP